MSTPRIKLLRLYHPQRGQTGNKPRELETVQRETATHDPEEQRSEPGAVNPRSQSSSEGLVKLLQTCTDEEISGKDGVMATAQDRML